MRRPSLLATFIPVPVFYSFYKAIFNTPSPHTHTQKTEIVLLFFLPESLWIWRFFPRQNIQYLDDRNKMASKSALWHERISDVWKEISRIFWVRSQLRAEIASNVVVTWHILFGELAPTCMFSLHFRFVHSNSKSHAPEGAPTFY